MKWSKVKKTAENLLADSLRGRVAYHLARYGPGLSWAQRGWVTLDTVQILNASNDEWYLHSTSVAYQIQAINNVQDFSNPVRWWKGYNAALDQAEDLSIKAVVFSRDQFLTAVQEYIDLSIDAAMSSENVLIRALAMFDRRLGKRRLVEMFLPDTEHPLVKQFYQIRCEAEELVPPSST